jgi:hypothetical protein
MSAYGSPLIIMDSGPETPHPPGGGFNFGPAWVDYGLGKNSMIPAPAFRLLSLMQTNAGFFSHIQHRLVQRQVGNRLRTVGGVDPLQRWCQRRAGNTCGSNGMPLYCAAPFSQCVCWQSSQSVPQNCHAVPEGAGSLKIKQQPPAGNRPMLRSAGLQRSPI